MTTMNISLPDNLKNYVDTQVEQGGYSTSSEYIREPILADKAFWEAKRSELLGEA